MKQVKCDSGAMGWKGKLSEVYTDLDEFVLYCNVFKLHRKLGFDSPEAAWEANPIVQGSVNPSDYRLSN